MVVDELSSSGDLRWTRERTEWSILAVSIDRLILGSVWTLLWNRCEQTIEHEFQRRTRTICSLHLPSGETNFNTSTHTLSFSLSLSLFVRFSFHSSYDVGKPMWIFLFHRRKKWLSTRRWHKSKWNGTTSSSMKSSIVISLTWVSINRHRHRMTLVFFS